MRKSKLRSIMHQVRCGDLDEISAVEKVKDLFISVIEQYDFMNLPDEEGLVDRLERL